MDSVASISGSTKNHHLLFKVKLDLIAFGQYLLEGVLVPLWHSRWYQVLQKQFQKTGYIFGLVCLSYGQTLQPCFCNIVGKVSRRNSVTLFTSPYQWDCGCEVNVMWRRENKFEGVLGAVCAFWETMLKLWRLWERAEESRSTTALTVRGVFNDCAPLEACFRPRGKYYCPSSAVTRSLSGWKSQNWTRLCSWSHWPFSSGREDREYDQKDLVESRMAFISAPVWIEIKNDCQPFSILIMRWTAASHRDQVISSNAAEEGVCDQTQQWKESLSQHSWFLSRNAHIFLI